MRLTTMRMTFVLSCLAIVLAGVGSARANGLSIEIYEGTNTPYVVSSSNGLNVRIDPSSSLLAAAAPDYTFTSFSAGTNEAATPLGDSILGSGEIAVKNPGFKFALTILISDNTYTYTPPPTGFLYTMESYSSYTVSPPGTPDPFASGSWSFQSFATQGADLFGTTGFASPGSTYTWRGGFYDPISGFNLESNTPFAFTPPPSVYTLTEEYVYVPLDYQSIQVFGNTQIVGYTAVPEPQSLALLFVGSLGLGLVEVRRRRSA